MFHISKWYCAIIHVRSEHMWKQASVYKENNDSGCFVSLFHNDGSQTALCTCGELSALCPRAVRLEQRTKAPWLIPWLTMCSCVLKNGTGDRCFLSVHIQGIPPNSTNAPPPSPSHDSTLHTCGYSLPRHANWSQLCGCGWGVHGWLKGCWSLRACVQVWEGAGWGCHVCILRVAAVFPPRNLAVKGWPWPCIDSSYTGGESFEAEPGMGPACHLLKRGACLLCGDGTNGRAACPVSGANHCLLVSFPLFSELLSRTAPTGRQERGAGVWEGSKAGWGGHQKKKKNLEVQQAAWKLLGCRRKEAKSKLNEAVSKKNLGGSKNILGVCSISGISGGWCSKPDIAC